MSEAFEKASKKVTIFNLERITLLAEMQSECWELCPQLFRNETIYISGMTSLWRIHVYNQRKKAKHHKLSWNAYISSPWAYCIDQWGKNTSSVFKAYAKYQRRLFKLSHIKWKIKKREAMANQWNIEAFAWGDRRMCGNLILYYKQTNRKHLGRHEAAGEYRLSCENSINQ